MMANDCWKTLDKFVRILEADLYNIRQSLANSLSWFEVFQDRLIHSEQISREGSLVSWANKSSK